MKLWTLLSEALRGWRAIFRKDNGWRAHFSLTAAGFVAALAVLVFTAFFAVVLVSSTFGMPHIIGIVMAMLVLSLPLVAVVIALQVTRAAMHTPVPLVDLLVPASFLLAAFIVVEGLLAMFGPVVMLSWVALGFALFRLARAATPWSRGVAIAFATLSVVLLVGMRIGLYMLTSMPGSPV